MRVADQCPNFESMKTIKLYLKQYFVLIDLVSKTVTFVCNETSMEKVRLMDSTRVYDFPTDKPISDIEVDEGLVNYIRIYFGGDGFLQIKLESSNEIVLDYFDCDGELIEMIGAWDFWDV